MFLFVLKQQVYDVKLELEAREIHSELRGQTFKHTGLFSKPLDTAAAAAAAARCFCMLSHLSRVLKMSSIKASPSDSRRTVHQEGRTLTIADM